MKEFLSKVPHGWWEEFRTRCMQACAMTYDAWQNRMSGRTSLTESERDVMRRIYEGMKKEFKAGRELE